MTDTVFEYKYEQSFSINEIAAALAAAQGEIENAAKNSQNPHFKSTYADLAEVVNVVREPLSRHKIARIQAVLTGPNGEAAVRTQLVHASGQWIAATAWVKPDRPGPQPFGACVTYLRRFSLASILGLAQEDDDGEAAHGRAPKGATSAAASATPVAKSTGLDPAAIRRVQCAVQPLRLGEDDAAKLFDRDKTQQAIYIRQARLDWIAEVVGRKVSSTKDLTVDEASDVVAAAAARQRGAA